MTLNAYNQRTALLLGEEAINSLSKAHVMIVGVGGVGAYAAETIARTGVGNITIIDGDDVAPSNLNRQLPALHSTIGQSKVEVMRQRINDINPGCNVTALKTFIGVDDIKSFLSPKPDFVIDAIDSISPKAALLEYCYRNKIKTISSMGAGGRVDPTQIKYADISETYHDGLAREIRKRLRKAGISSGIKTVFSTEQPRKTSLIMTDEIAFKTSSFGTVAWLPSIFGIMLAAYAINNIIEK